MLVFLGVGEVQGSFRRPRLPVTVVALVFLLASFAAFALNLGHISRIFNILGHVGSPISQQLIVILVSIVLTVVYALLVWKKYGTAAKISGILLLIAGVVVPVANGMTFASIDARPAWNSVLVPVMFLGTSLGMGFPLAALLSKTESAPERFLKTQLVLCSVIVAALTILLYTIWVGIAPYPDESRSVMRLLTGDLSVMYWGLVVFVGIVIPLVCSVVSLLRVRKAGAETVSAMPLSLMLAVTFLCSTAGAVVIRMLLYILGTRVEQFTGFNGVFFN